MESPVWFLSCGMVNLLLLHDRPWISPWIKSISNELDIPIHGIASQCLVIMTSSAIDCDVISSIQTERVRHAIDVRRSSFYSHLWIRSVVQEIKQCMYSRDELFMRSLECYFGIYFPRCCATREINTKITLSWAHKPFATGLHTLFSISVAEFSGP